MKQSWAHYVTVGCYRGLYRTLPR